MIETKMVGLICAVTLIGLPALAKDKHSKTVKSPKAAAEESSVTAPSMAEPAKARSSEPFVKVDWQFSTMERARIQEYVQSYPHNGKPKNLPPGLAKKVARGGELPPGWQKKCVVGETMPVEVYERCRPLPPDLVVKLPPAPEPTITVAIGGKVVRLLEATRQILDVFDVHVNL